MVVTNGGQTNAAQVPSAALEFAKGQDEETRTRKSKRPLREYIGPCKFLRITARYFEGELFLAIWLVRFLVKITSG